MSKTPRTGLKGSGTMAPPSWTPRRADAVGSLTPAAKRLLGRTTTGTAAARRAETMGEIASWEGAGPKGKDKDLNRVRWTPTPSPATGRG
jgi:protein DGCR14